MHIHPLLIVWLIAGLLLGVAHAATLWNSVRGGASPWLPLTGLLRLVVLGVVFTGAVLSGGILPAGAGWALGFAGAAGAVFFRKQRR